MKIIGSYTFNIVAAASVLLSIATSLIGSINVFKKQSLVGDAIGHASYPGIIIAFMVSKSRSPFILLTGAALLGGAAYHLIQKSEKRTTIPLDGNLAIFLSGFFGLGMVLKTYIQGNARFARASQAGLDAYIFGQTSFLLELDLVMIAIVALACVLFFTLFYKEIKLYLFDREFSAVIGLPTKLMDALILVMTILVISVGLKSVGALLISSFLILPVIAAEQWSDKFFNVLVISCIMSMTSSLIGNYLSFAGEGVATGPVIVLISCIFAFLSMMFGKRSHIFGKRRES